MQQATPSSEDFKDPLQRAQPRFLHLALLKMFAFFLALAVLLCLLSLYMMREIGVGATTLRAVVGPDLRPCGVDEQGGLERWVRPLASATHAMTDKELFWQASLVPQVKKYPFRWVKKFAFMFLTKGPLPLARLWEKFFSRHEELYSIYVHALPSYHN